MSNSLNLKYANLPTDNIVYAKQILVHEAQAVENLCSLLDDNFNLAIELLLRCSGKVVVIGMGKSGHIANKIAATLASTGTSAFFVHPAELRHGDLGMLNSKDTAIILSGSGETNEIKVVLEPIKRMGIKIISLTGNLESTLAKVSDCVINVKVESEACPFNLAPTSSTTATLAMGDAIALTLMKERKFTPEDFAKSHPGGSLGKQLITVQDVMRQGQKVPIVYPSYSFRQVLDEINLKKLGLTLVCDDQDKLIGVITDGDLRRALSNSQEKLFSNTASQIMTSNPKTIKLDALAQEALKIMEEFLIADLIIVDNSNKPIGVIDLKDLLKAGII